MKKIAIGLILLTFTIGIVAVLKNPVFAAWGLEGAAEGTGLIQPGVGGATESIYTLIGKIVGVALSFLGIIFFLLVLYAGFMWMTAFGKADKTEKAKEIIEAAGLGLLIVLAAYAITNFIFTSLAVGGNNETASIETSEDFTVCESTYPGEGYCTDRSNCQALIDSGSKPGTSIKTGLCPGGVDNICCVIPGGASTP